MPAAAIATLSSSKIKLKCEQQQNHPACCAFRWPRCHGGNIAHGVRHVNGILRNYPYLEQYGTSIDNWEQAQEMADLFSVKCDNVATFLGGKLDVRSKDELGNDFHTRVWARASSITWGRSLLRCTTSGVWSSALRRRRTRHCFQTLPDGKGNMFIIRRWRENKIHSFRVKFYPLDIPHFFKAG
jgi:hypothetical protein